VVRKCRVSGEGGVKRGVQADPSHRIGNEYQEQRPLSGDLTSNLVVIDGRTEEGARIEEVAGHQSKLSQLEQAGWSSREGEPIGSRRL